MATLQVKGIHEELYKALGARAAMDHRSISQEVIFMIKDYLSRASPGDLSTRPCLMDLAGSWKDNRDAATISKAIRNERCNRRSFTKG